MRKTFNANHDQAVADDAIRGFTAEQLCAAERCPNRWTIASSRCCTAHHSGSKLDWPKITAEQRMADTDAVLARQNAGPPDAFMLSREDKLALLAKLRNLLTAPKNPLQWAFVLRDREKAGEELSEYQRACWRNALGEAAAPLAPDDDPRTQRLKAETAKRVLAYAKKFNLTLEDADTLLARDRGRHQSPTRDGSPTRARFAGSVR